MNQAAKYSTIMGIASMNIEMTSADGVAMAVKSTITRIAMRHDLMIAAALMIPAKFSSTMNTGSTNAMPIATHELQHEVDVLLGGEQ